MPQRREPAIRVQVPLRRRNSGNFRGRRALWLAVILGVGTACGGRNDGATGSTQQPPHAGRRGPTSPFSDMVGRVGNQVRGIDAIPDYDAEAEALRARVEPRLPSPLPSSKAACTTMLEAARQFYVDTEGEESVAVATMDATHDDDLNDCTAQTEPAAASCVAVLMAQNEGEFAWVLDQCRRAFGRVAKG